MGQFLNQLNSQTVFPYNITPEDIAEGMGLPNGIAPGGFSTTGSSPTASGEVELENSAWNNVVQVSAGTTSIALPTTNPTGAYIWFYPNSVSSNSYWVLNVIGDGQYLYSPSTGITGNTTTTAQIPYNSTVVVCCKGNGAIDIIGGTYISSNNVSPNFLNPLNNQLIYIGDNIALPLGIVNLQYSNGLNTNGGYFSYDNVIYKVPDYSYFYETNSDTFEYVNNQLEIYRITLPSGSALPAIPNGYAPFQKVATTSIETPAAVVALVTTGGSLAAGTYEYQIVMINPSGNSLPSPVTSITVPDNSAVNLAWRVSPYSSEVQLYRNGYLLYTSYTGYINGQEYTDTGTVTTDTPIPTTNTSNFVYKCTPLYDVVNVLKDKKIRISRYNPYQYQDITALLLGLIEYGNSIWQGTNYNPNIDGVNIIIPDGTFVIGQPIQVLEGITLDIESNGYLMNKCPDIYAPCITFNAGSFSNELQILGNNNSGIIVGAIGIQVDAHFGNIRIQGCGLNYNSILGISQTSMSMSGYNHSIDSLQIYQGNTGLQMNQAGDVRIGKAIIIRAETNLSMSGCTQVGINYIDLDTPGYMAASIDACQDIFIRGVMWINGQNYTGGAFNSNFLQIGAYTSDTYPNSALNLSLNLLNCGSKPLYLSNITESKIDLIVGKGGQTEYPPQSVVTYGPNVSENVLITGTTSIPITSDWNNGTTPNGCYHLYVNGVLQSS